MADRLFEDVDKLRDFFEQLEGKLVLAGCADTLSTWTLSLVLIKLSAQAPVVSLYWPICWRLSS